MLGKYCRWQWANCQLNSQNKRKTRNDMNKPKTQYAHIFSKQIDAKKDALCKPFHLPFRISI